MMPMTRRALLRFIPLLPLLPRALSSSYAERVLQSVQRLFGSTAHLVPYTRQSIAWSRANVPGSTVRFGDGWIESGGKMIGLVCGGEVSKVIDRVGRMARIF
jgi:hypothetical protein